MDKIKRSPLFYVGDKFKLMKQLLPMFPKEINNYYEPFAGGGTVFLNVKAKKYFLNDNNKHLVSIHKFLLSNADNIQKFFDSVYNLIDKYKLSRSYKEDIVPQNLKKQFKKTYYAQFNKGGYERLKAQVNNNTDNDPLVLYILLIYGFNRMLRFNGGGKFNLPVGNVDFNKNVEKALFNYFDFAKDKRIIFDSKDFKNYFKNKKYSNNDFVYLDPPYLITASEYNKFWTEQSEKDLLAVIDDLNQKKVKFALSNVTHYRG
ncbi:MAG: Dam family site-specific DNA-(adenine-N6)-methyltransferase, partial [Endomicrobium sp.]|nr:Dam family site-specific DNA-(adenine-N6)-methyltransferase [Endomicrobium sp.]